MAEFLEYFEQFRFISSGLFFIFLPMPKTLKRRSGFWWRMALSFAILFAIGFAYVPFMHAYKSTIAQAPMMLLGYWVGIYLIYFAAVIFCYDINLGEAMFRTSIGSFAETIYTALFHDLIAKTLFPTLSSDYPWAYIGVALGLEAIVMPVFYFFVQRDIRKDVINRYDERKRGFLICLIFLLFNVFYHLLTRHFLESVFAKMAQDPAYKQAYESFRIFAIATMVLISAGSSFLLQMVYRSFVNYDEKKTMERLSNERIHQLSELEENIAVIKKKSHDLKNQIYAFAEMDSAERQRKWEEVESALEFYDANVSTLSHPIDALIMEKGLRCKQNQIRFTPVIKTDLIPSLPIYELSTILGNGLDNAIEASLPLDPKDRSIRLEISSHANIVYLEIANYFAGTVDFSHGLPKTKKKKEKAFHGFGLASIQEAVKSIGGQIEFKAEGGTFLLSCIFVV